MKVDAGLMGGLEEVPRRIRELEAAGYDGAITAETSHDPFFPLLLAAEHSTRIELMTSIAVAFARNPMILANLAHDLNAYSKGRFILGLGSQIQPHITKRFSQPWSHPAARMRELILATPTAGAMPSLAELAERVRILCTVYDPDTGEYRYNWRLLFEIIGGSAFFLTAIVYLLRERRLQRRARAALPGSAQGA